MLKLPILNIEKKFPNATLYDQITKIEEEVAEVRSAETLEDKVSETLDLIQSAMGFLEMVEGIVDLKSLNVEHTQKLSDRGWTFEGMFNITKEEW